MIKEEFFNSDQLLLSETMSNISQNNWYAGWLGSLEFIIWEALMFGYEDSQFSYEGFREDLNLCRELSEKLDGWMTWNFEAGIYANGEVVFVSMEEWAEKLSKRYFK